MLRKLIGTIRRQPKHTRDNVALGIASTVTFVVAAVWMLNAPATFSGMLGVDGGEGQTANFFDKMSEQTAAVKEVFTAEDSPAASVKDLIADYQAEVSATTSAQSESENTAASATTSSPQSASQQPESFTTDSSYETDKPKEVRIQAISKATTSTTTNE
jgi:hypothetical protein